MKLSLAWLCDHLSIAFDQLDIEHLTNNLTQITAEIEAVRYINLKHENFKLLRVVNVGESDILCQCVDSNFEITLPHRPDLDTGMLVVLFQKDNEKRWATLKDLGSERGELIPPIFFPEAQIDNWRSHLEIRDCIVEFDNKSINHRPDLWGHRGFAREVSAILEIPLVSEEAICMNVPVQDYMNVSAENASPSGLRVSIEDVNRCRRLAALYFPYIENRPSHLFLASRLARIDAKPISSIVDLTNYVMFDFGQPLHAFDAEKIPNTTLIAKSAKKGQSIQLLDDKKIALTEQDLVISDGTRPLALAGIMGGVQTAVKKNTSSLIIEAANFDADTIRKSSKRFKLRTDASTRFEKGLDPNANIPAIKRLVKLANDITLEVTFDEPIISVGQPMEPSALTISHEVIEKKLGFSVSRELVSNKLSRLGFDVFLSEDQYKITIPTFRAKDITLQEDIIEEVGRFILIGKSQFKLPSKITQPNDTYVIHITRKIKDLLAYSLSMHEVYNYNLYDAQFLQELAYIPEQEIPLKNPVSEHWKLLVTSLIPHLIKNVVENHTRYDELRFFELSRIWRMSNNAIIENKRLSGVFWHNEMINFYEKKSLLSLFFKGLSLEVEWEKDNLSFPWWSIHQTAKIVCQGETIGYAGMINPQFIAPVLNGQAFIFDFDLDLLLTVKRKEPRFSLLSKYQPVKLDISMFIPLTLTVSKIEHMIASSDHRIREVELIDYYEKEEWVDKRSVTLRYIVQDYDKTMSKQEIEEVIRTVERNAMAQGCVIR